MTSSMPVEDAERMETRLRAVLGFVDGHVRFAETKNAALLSANAATLFAVLQAINRTPPMGVWLHRYLLVLATASMLSLIVVLLSFLPVTQIPWLSRPPKRRPEPNLLFFGDIQRLDGSAYLTDLILATENGQVRWTPFHRMHADQLVVNARIASRKFTYFKVGIWFTMAGVLTPVIAGALLLWATTR
jgi:hypothetical protein